MKVHLLLLSHFTNRKTNRQKKKKNRNPAKHNPFGGGKDTLKNRRQNYKGVKKEILKFVGNSKTQKEIYGEVIPFFTVDDTMIRTIFTNLVKTARLLGLERPKVNRLVLGLRPITLYNLVMISLIVFT